MTEFVSILNKFKAGFRTFWISVKTTARLFRSAKIPIDHSNQLGEAQENMEDAKRIWDQIDSDLVASLTDDRDRRLRDKFSLH